MKKIWIIVIGVLLVLSSVVWYKYFFVFGEGVKSGYLNYAMKKGYVFKTYEGKLIQEGFGRGKTGGLTSYQFEFSIENEAVFKQLEENSGKNFDLHYKEYNGAIPWRGNTKYIVDKVVNMK
jgi:flagellar basal body-associated protein FliL